MLWQNINYMSRSRGFVKWISRLKVLSHEATCRNDMSLRQNHLHDTRCDLTVQHVACDTPVPPNGTGNELTIKVASQGRPAIGLFRVVAATCRKCMPHEGTELCVRHFVAATCPMNSNWFEFMRQVAATCRGVKLHQNIHQCHTRRLVAGTCRSDKSRRQVASCISFVKSSFFYFKCLALFTVYKLTCMRK